MNTLPSKEHFIKSLEDGKQPLLYTCVPIDTDTPVSAYLKLCEKETYAFLYESVEGAKTVGRYSAIGFDPDMIWTIKSKVSTYKSLLTSTVKSSDTPLDDLKDRLEESRIETPKDTELPPMLTSGLFGYMGYNTIQLVEDLPTHENDTIGLPDTIMVRPRTILVFDNIYHKLWISAPAYDSYKGDHQTIYDACEKRIHDTLMKLRQAIPQDTIINKDTLDTPLDFKANMKESHFKDIVTKAKEYILNGDIFQVVLSQRFTSKFPLPPFEFYRSLRRINPSPFLFYIKMEGFSLAGSSPELMVRVREKTVTIRPIAGTRIRGKNDAEDIALKNELLADKKECAEHLMLLDLGRNDVGKVSEIGSVNVTSKYEVELYSHVMHIVSNVEGTLKKGLHPLDALMSGFPAGTVSGAPKIRAMEIINELETEARNHYAGCIGYLDASGNIDNCIALRTALIKNGEIMIQSGAGVVADSDPQSEYQETVNKAKALITAAKDAIDITKQRLSGN